MEARQFNGFSRESSEDCVAQRVVFCTTNKGRTQHLEQTLPRNLADNADCPNCKFVVLDYNSPDHMASYLLANHKDEIARGRLVVYSMLPGPDGPIPFRMAHAKNMAHRCGLLEGADILVNLDADNYTGHRFAEYIAEEMADPNTFLWSRMQPGKLSRGISGRIAVSGKAFVKAGGYDEKYETWSPDDKDFNARLQRLGFTAKEIDERFLGAVGHNDKIRFKEYQHVATQHGEDTFEVSETATIANFGNVGCGTVYRNFDFSKPIDLKPIPTRIFGIGMHKTATTSLHAALSILGYDSAHWKSAHWAKAIWDDMKANGKSSTLEKHYALSDLPIPLLFRELDVAYPGSKFILTIRPENQWLDSIRRHWNRDTNRFRAQWDNDPFTHYIHRQTYGRRDFHPDTMLAAYRRHNADVISYFAGRPDDLLVFPSDDWAELWRFLGCTTPDSFYPTRNESVN